MTHMTPEQVVTEFARTIPVLENEAEKAMQAAVDLTFQRMSELAPKGATGDLARNMTHSVRKTAEGVSGLVRPRAKYARFVEEGTGQGKTLRGAHGEAFSAMTGSSVSGAHEAADPLALATASGWGSKTPGRTLALHVKGGVVYRRRVRGQRARNFVQRTRENVVDEVEHLLAVAAEHATRRLFP